jgi:hypothetical protein
MPRRQENLGVQRILKVARVGFSLKLSGTFLEGEGEKKPPRH